MCLVHNMHLLSMVTGSSQAHIVQAQIVDVHAASVRRTWRLCKALGTPTATRQPAFVHTEHVMNPHIWKLPEGTAAQQAGGASCREGPLKEATCI